ncbi:hypothetical protein CP955_20895, partial [Enterobacter sp. HN503E2II]|uniref:hypothetical protein n=1 Tax=Enterobacter sp. HN503E2II TaxID=2041079 RepID=UPI000D571DA7
MELSSPDFSKIRYNLNNFIDVLEGIEETLPTIRRNLYRDFKEKEKQSDEFILAHSYQREYDEEGTLIKYKMPFEKQRELYFLMRSVHKSLKTARAIPSSVLVSIGSEYDAYLGVLLKEIYLSKPEIINSLEKNLTFNEIMEFGSIDKIKDFVIEKDIETTLRKSHLE